MKRNWNTWITGIVLALLVPGLASCTFESGTEITTEHFTVAQRDWQWNPLYDRYEYIIDYPGLGHDVYLKGTVLGTVYVAEEDAHGGIYEIQKSLPFVESLPLGNRSYTRIISFDIAPRQVTFYIQTSDLSDDPAILGNYRFKITLVWEREYR